MHLPNEMAIVRQQEMLATAAVQRRALRVRALGRATRRADRAGHRLTRSLREAARLRAGVVAELDR